MARIDVKKSTLATWCRDIELTDTQKAAIWERTGSRAGIPVDTQWRRRQEIREVQEHARLEAASLIDEPLWIAGVVLYWAEGNKTKARLGLTNSDPRTLRLFVHWCRAYHVRDAAFTLRVTLHHDNDEAAAREWWVSTTGLLDATIHKSFIKPEGTGHRKNHLQYVFLHGHNETKR